MPIPKHSLRGLPQLGRTVDARLRSAERSSLPPPLPASLGSAPRQPLGLPSGTGRAPLSTLRGGGTPGGGGLTGGAAAGDPHAPAYPEEFPAAAPPSVQQVFQSCAAPVSAGNSLAETSLAPDGLGSLALPAGFFAPGRALEFTLAGAYTGDEFMSAGYTATLRLWLGSACVLSAALPSGPYTYAGRWSARLRLVCLADGASPQFAGHGTLLAHGSPLSFPVLPTSVLLWNFANPAVDTADPLTLDITVQHDEALPGNSTALDDLAVLQTN